MGADLGPGFHNGLRRRIDRSRTELELRDNTPRRVVKVPGNGANRLAHGIF